MKIIFSNNAVITSASSALSEFPAGRVLESGLKRRWILDPLDSYPGIVLSVNAPGNAIMIDNVTGASGATVTISNSGGVVKSESIMFSHTNGFGAFSTPRAWVDYPDQLTEHSIAISFTGSEIAVGIIYAGKAFRFPNPEWGVDPGDNDFVIREKLENGFEYATGQNRNRQRTFKGVVNITDLETYFGITHLLRQTYPGPMACLVLDGMGQQAEWAIYGGLAQLPGRPLARYSNYPISFSIVEKL